MKKIRKLLAIVLLIFMFSHTAYAETYEYDALDRVTKVIYDDGSYVTYEYDASGNMISTQVSEPEQEEGFEAMIENILESIESQVTELVGQIVQDVQAIISNLFGWIFG